jgi:hypothetical protein
MSPKITSTLTLPFITLSALLIAGCGKSEPEYVEVREVQEVPEQDPHAGHNHAPGEHGQVAAAAESASGVGFAYTVPEGWVEQAPSSMKLLSLAIGSPPELISELSVSAFPGDVGGQLANINRWRRQVGLGPITPEAMDGFVTNVLVSGLAGWQVDFTGPMGTGQNGGAARIVTTAVFKDGQTWFFKLAGNNTALDDELDKYAEFLKSVQF